MPSSAARAPIRVAARSFVNLVLFSGNIAAVVDGCLYSLLELRHRRRGLVAKVVLSCGVLLGVDDPLLLGLAQMPWILQIDA